MRNREGLEVGTEATGSEIRLVAGAGSGGVKQRRAHALKEVPPSRSWAWLREAIRLRMQRAYTRDVGYKKA